MAVQRNDQNNQQQQNQQAAEQQAQQQQQQQQQGFQQQAQQTQPTGGFGYQQQQQATSIFGSNGSENPFSLFALQTKPRPEAIEEIVEQFNSFSAQAPNGMKTSVIVVDNNNYQDLQYSVIVLVAEATILSDKPVAYHGYLIEASGKPLPFINRTIDGQNIEISAFPSDAYDATLRDVVEREVSAQYPGRRLLETSMQLIHKSFDLTKDLYQLFAVGLAACRTELDLCYSNVDMNLKGAQTEKGLVVSVERTNQEMVMDLGQLPCRADLIIRTTARPSNPNQITSLNNQKQAMVAQSCGYIDLTWVRPAQNQHVAWAGMQQQQQAQFDPMYAPMYIQTFGMPETVQSVPAQLLALTCTGVLAENNYWSVGLMPRKGVGKKNELSLTDIGAVGIDANWSKNPDGVGNRLTDTTSENFGMAQLTQLLSMTCTRELLMAIDVPVCGSTTWQHAIFAAAADGNQDANNDIILAANYLTNGNFSKYFEGNQRVCYNYGGTILMGYYQDRNNQIRDIREIGYLAILNIFGESNMNVVRDWADSFTNDSKSLELRLDKRKKILETFSPVYTGKATRVVFNGQFINALMKACHECGLTLRPDTPYMGEGTAEIRTPFSFYQQAQINPQQTGLFASGLGGGNNGNSFYGNTWSGYVGGNMQHQGAKWR